MKRTTSATVFCVMIFMASMMLTSAQTKQEALETFKAGIKAKQNGDLEKAIEDVEKSIDMCEAIGSSADQVKIKAQNQLPSLYFDRGMKLYKNKKIDQALKIFQKAQKTAQEYNISSTEKKARNVVAQLYRVKGVNHFSNQEYEEAMRFYNKAIETDSTYARPYYNKAALYKEKGNEKEFVDQVDRAIRIAKEADDDKTLKKASKIAKNYFYNKGIKAKKAASYENAEEYLQKSLSYKKYDRGYYVLGLVKNEQKQWDEALKTLKKGIKYIDETDKETSSKFYFEQGRAYQGKGEEDKACAAYKKVTEGAYKKSAKYQIKHVLECNKD